MNRCKFCNKYYAGDEITEFVDLDNMVTFLSCQICALKEGDKYLEKYVKRVKEIEDWKRVTNKKYIESIKKV